MKNDTPFAFTYLSRRLSLLGVAISSWFAAVGMHGEPNGHTMDLNGTWEIGLERRYDRKVRVPGLASDATEIAPGTLWYRRSVTLPEGTWQHATLELNGARFAPAVYVDGQKVSATEGGMAPTVHPLASPAVAPGRTVTLEIALQSLRDVSLDDASATPMADRWRTNVSSGLWDVVRLHLSGEARIARITPWTAFIGRKVAVHWELERGSASALDLTVQAVLTDAGGATIAASSPAAVADVSGIANLDLPESCQPWSPEAPNLYRLQLIVRREGQIQDQREITWGLREFRVEGLQFSLNRHPVKLRAGTVVWHRFLTDPEGRELCFDTAWFDREVVQRLRAMGANTLRYHLGTPPEELLDLCDRAGLMVQLEWPFFHGVAASVESMRLQWRSWLDLAMRHPSVVLIHPWNETQGEELAKADQAIDSLLPFYPPLVISHRDVLHVHKYWWSLFENVGLYYDAPEDFTLPIMSDEFGGNYLDGEGNMGGYPMVRESTLRFLGRNSTKEQRLRHQAESNARIAEYWRRLGAAGFSPFCILGAPLDGNHWFMGSLENPTPKPVWAALSAAYAPQSVSLETWNRNYVPGQQTELPLHFFNDTGKASELTASVRIVTDDPAGRVVSSSQVTAQVPAYGSAKQSVKLTLPGEAGEWRIEAELTTPVEEVKGPIVSSWRCRTLAPAASSSLKHAVVGVRRDDVELATVLASQHIRTVGLDDPSAQVLAISGRGWKEVTESPELKAQLDAAVKQGKSLLLLDAGPRELGAAYIPNGGGTLDGQPKVAKPREEAHTLFSGLRVSFRQIAEAESHLHPAAANSPLWRNLPQESTWLWNGLRGGLIVPATEMEIVGLSPDAFLALWENRGADRQLITGADSYYAFEIAGHYAFSREEKDEATIAKLRAQVAFLVEDAPSLAKRIFPGAPPIVHNLVKTFREAGAAGEASEVAALAMCGRNLTRVPVTAVSFGPGRGRVVLSQLFTAGRLASSAQPLKLYELGHDPAAEQFVLNLLDFTLTGK